MSKTIKEIAEELGVSKQAVFKKIKKEPLSTSLQQFISTVDGVVYISVDGAKLVAEAFNKDSPSTVVDNQPSTNHQLVYDQLIATLQENQELLRKEIEEKNKQIQQLQKLLEQQQLLLDQQQHLNLLDKNKILQIEEKSSFWKRKKKQKNYNI